MFNLFTMIVACGIAVAAGIETNPAAEMANVVRMDLMELRNVVREEGRALISNLSTFWRDETFRDVAEEKDVEQLRQTVKEAVSMLGQQKSQLLQLRDALWELNVLLSAIQTAEKQQLIMNIIRSVRSPEACMIMFAWGLSAGGGWSVPCIALAFLLDPVTCVILVVVQFIYASTLRLSQLPMFRCLLPLIRRGRSAPPDVEANMAEIIDDAVRGGNRPGPVTNAEGDAPNSPGFLSMILSWLWESMPTVRRAPPS